MIKKEKNENKGNRNKGNRNKGNINKDNKNKKNKKTDRNKGNNVSICFYSSMIFIVNILICYVYHYYNYSLLFVSLLITSLIHHKYSTQITNIIDKISIIGVVTCGGIIFYNKCCQINNYKQLTISLLILATFFITNYLFIYGYLIKKYCFHKNYDIACLYHSIMHIIVSIGHILIVIM